MNVIKFNALKLKNSKINLFLVLFSMLFATTTFSQSFVNLDGEALKASKEALNKGNATIESIDAYKKLLTHSDRLLELPNPTVIDKVLVTPSNNNHDYLSISRYWWPDESKPNGLPWLRRDGVTNPSTQNDDVDKRRIELMTNSVKDLALAYYFSEQEKYAKKAASLIHTWFLDEKTMMNPNLEYAQSVPGYYEGRRSGILDGRIISQRVLDAIVMISKSKYWSEDYDKQMNQWLSEYLTWLTSSDLGKEGGKQTNNHGSWYEYQVAALSFYLGDEEKMVRAVENAQTIFSSQFDATGAQPHELERTRSYFYSTFNLEALVSIATIANKAGISMWGYESKKGASLMKGIEFLIPAAKGDEWEYNSEVQGVTPDYLLPLLAAIPNDMKTKEHTQLLTELLNKLAKNKDKEVYQERIYNIFLLYLPQYIKEA